MLGQIVGSEGLGKLCLFWRRLGGGGVGSVGVVYQNRPESLIAGVSGLGRWLYTLGLWWMPFWGGFGGFLPT